MQRFKPMMADERSRKRLEIWLASILKPDVLEESIKFTRNSECLNMHASRVWRVDNSPLALEDRTKLDLAAMVG